MSKKIVINNDMVQQTKSHITNLFKPPYNPFTDRSTTKNFALQYYAYDKDQNPVKTMYNTENVITNLFLVTEDFITFMNRINSIWAADSLPRLMNEIQYATSSSVGYTTVGSINSAGANVVMPLVKGPTGNKATHFEQYESFAKHGLWGTGGTQYDGIGSTSIQELMLRYLYSLDSAKRDVAFQIAELYYGVTNSECVAAKLGFLPAKDFNSDNFTITASGDEITLNYPNPIEFAIHYDETIHNPNGKNLYLYFPYITSNAMRPKVVGSDTSAEDGLISIYTGTNLGYWTSTALPDTAGAAAFDRVGVTNMIRNRPSSANSYGDLIWNDSMAVLTNAVWSVKANKFVNQAGYTVIQISETGAGGDITFDHTDKIDFIDSLKFIIKAPTVFA